MKEKLTETKLDLSSKCETLIDRTRSKGDLGICEERLRDSACELLKKFHEVCFEVQEKGFEQIAEARELGDDPMVAFDDFRRVRLPLAKIGWELWIWYDQVCELIDNQFEFAGSPFEAEVNRPESQNDPSG